MFMRLCDPPNTGAAVFHAGGEFLSNSLAVNNCSRRCPLLWSIGEETVAYLHILKRVTLCNLAGWDWDAFLYLGFCHTLRICIACLAGQMFMRHVSTRDLELQWTIFLPIGRIQLSSGRSRHILLGALLGIDGIFLLVGPVHSPLILALHGLPHSLS